MIPPSTSRPALETSPVEPTPQAWQIAAWACLWLVSWVGLSALVGWLEP
ncbi:hypothetical protein [Chitinimonas arctica]|nr:hypothetical protein [Chitinimonas arctica]